jgi:hypothetical protein
MSFLMKEHGISEGNFQSSDMRYQCAMEYTKKTQVLLYNSITKEWHNFLCGCLYIFNCLFIYSYVYTLFGPSLSPAPYTPASRQNLFHPLLQFCWRENMRDSKKDIAFLLAWDKDSYTERFLPLLPCTCVLQPQLFHLY